MLTQTEKPGQSIIILPQQKGSTDILTIIAIAGGLGAVGAGLWWYLTRKATPEFQLHPADSDAGINRRGRSDNHIGQGEECHEY